MKRKLRNGFFFFLSLCLFLLCSTPVVCFAESISSAAGLSLTSDSETATRGKTWSISVQFHDLSATELSAFRLQLSYDTDYLTLRRITPGAALKQGDFSMYQDADGANVIYASQDTPYSEEDGVCCTFVFFVNEDAAAGSASVTVTADQLVSVDLEKQSGTLTASGTVEMNRILSQEALLESLVPSAGELTPNFSPEITEYTLQVPYAVTELTFTSTAKDRGTVRVNRKTLKKAGEATTFLLTVTSEDGQHKTEYVVTATRSTKQTSGTTSASAGSSTSSSAASPSSRSTSGSSVLTQAAAGTEGVRGDTILYGSRSVYYTTNTFPFILIAILLGCILALGVVGLVLWYRKQKRS